jgi:hypothetical protein
MGTCACILTEAKIKKVRQPKSRSMPLSRKQARVEASFEYDYSVRLTSSKIRRPTPRVVCSLVTQNGELNRKAIAYLKARLTDIFDRELHANLNQTFPEMPWLFEKPKRGCFTRRTTQQIKERNRSYSTHLNSRTTMNQFIK